MADRQPFQDRTHELQAATAALGQNSQMHSRELLAAEWLQHVSTQLITARGTEPLYEHILDTALVVLGAEFASIQQFYPERGSSGELRLLGHRGFSTEATERWQWVRETTRTTCGEALRIGGRVAVADVRNCEFMAGSE